MPVHVLVVFVMMMAHGLRRSGQLTLRRGLVLGLHAEQYGQECYGDEQGGSSHLYLQGGNPK
jgi:hypothetical protein